MTSEEANHIHENLATEVVKIGDVYTFGQPRVGNKAFYDWYATNVYNSWRVTHYKDIIPHVPPEKLGFHHISTLLFFFSFFFLFISTNLKILSSSTLKMLKYIITKTIKSIMYVIFQVRTVLVRISGTLVILII